jgi:hypothetical protein
MRRGFVLKLVLWLPRNNSESEVHVVGYYKVK